MPFMREDPPVTTANNPPTANLTLPVTSVAGGNQNTGAQTRSSSPTILSGELFLRVNAQHEIMEAIDDMLLQANEPGDITLTEVSMMLDQLEELYQAFRTEHAWLVSHWPPAHLDHSYFTRKVSSNASKVVLKVKRQLGRLKEQLTGAAPAANTPATSGRARPRLPELTVPTFSGDCRKWPDFKAMFLSVIGSRTDIDDLEKLHYLRSAMKDEAADLIANLAPSAGAYAGAWSILDMRYENKRLVIKTHLERLLNLKPMTKRQANSLTKMVTIINETTQSLRTLTEESNNDCLMVMIASRLLDTDTREKWEGSIASTDEFPSLSQFTDFLLSRARTLENITETPATIQPANSRGAIPKRASSHQASAQPPSSSAQTTQKTTEPASRPNAYPCDCCGQDHFVVRCPKFRDNSLEQRMKVVKDRSLCCNCLGRHTARKCNNTRHCKTCNDAHHTMLHGADLSVIFGSSKETNQPPGATA